MISFKQFLKESPDLSINTSRETLKPFAEDAYTFTILDGTDCALYGSTGRDGITHDHIADYIQGDNWTPRIKLIGDRRELTRYMDSVDADIESREGYGLSGRVWVDSDVVSFWRLPVYAISDKELAMLDKILTAVGVKIEDAYFDNNLDEEENLSSNLISYKELVSKMNGRKRNYDFSKIKHVVDPKVKNLLKDLTVDMPISDLEKAADDMGITVAQLKSKLSSD